MPTVVPVRSLIPDIREVTAVNNSALNQLTSIRDVMQTPAGRWQVASFTTNASSQVTALMLQYGSMQLCLRATSTTQLLCSLHPEGGVTDINAPSTPTGSDERSINAYTGGTNLLTLTNGKIQIAELEGVISIFFCDDSNVWVAGIHAGQIYYPDNRSDELKGFEGYGILIGRPGAWGNNTGSTLDDYGRAMWLGRQASNTTEANYTGSVVRVPGPAWLIPTFRSLPNQFSNETAEGAPNDVNGSPRLKPVEMTLKNFSDLAAGPSIIGNLRFVRQTRVFPIQIENSDQYWSSNYLKFTTTTSTSPAAYDIRNLVFVWNKNYPTPS